MKNSNLTKIYYAILLTILGIKIITTIFSNGLSVHHGKKISQLQIQKTNLQQQELRLRSELSHKSSISQITTQINISEFIAVSNPIVLSSATTVASN